MKKLVISGINLFEGGPLTVYYDCLNTLIENKVNESFQIVAFVHKKELFENYVDTIKIIELPNSRKNYLFRLWYEYIYFYFFSKKEMIDIWISLHDITPHVKAKKRFVYCHNATPFIKTTFKSFKYSPANFFFSLFYKFLYKINIKKNTSVIVQQDWIRNEFINMFNISSVIVAKPTIIENNQKIIKNQLNKKLTNDFSFIFPSFPRYFKNFEVMCEAAEKLEMRKLPFEVILTIDGTENKYSEDIVRKFENNNSIKFIGLQDRNILLELYNQVDCMIFPSKLETWGLPITEFKETGKPMILADRPYAHETIGNYRKVSFFDETSSDELSEKMYRELSSTQEYEESTEIKINKPYANNWTELIDLITS